MGKLNDAKFPLQVLADWPSDCLFLGTGRRSPTPVPFWRKHTHGLTNGTCLPNTVPKEESISRDVKCLKQYEVNQQAPFKTKLHTPMLIEWLTINHIYASAWIVDQDKYTFPPTLLSTSTSSWKQIHASGSQTCPEYKKPLHPFFPQSYFWSLYAQRAWLSGKASVLWRTVPPKCFNF